MKKIRFLKILTLIITEIGIFTVTTNAMNSTNNIKKNGVTPNQYRRFMFYVNNNNNVGFDLKNKNQNQNMAYSYNIKNDNYDKSIDYCNNDFLINNRDKNKTVIGTYKELNFNDLTYKKRNFSNLRQHKFGAAMYDNKKTNYTKYDLNNIKNINNNHNNNYNYNNYNNYNKEENLNNNEIQRKVLGKRLKQYKNIYNLAKYNDDRENEKNELESRLESLLKKCQIFEQNYKPKNELGRKNYYLELQNMKKEFNQIKEKEGQIKEYKLEYLYAKIKKILKNSNIPIPILLRTNEGTYNIPILASRNENIYNFKKYNDDRDNEKNELKSRLESLLKEFEDFKNKIKPGDKSDYQKLSKLKGMQARFSEIGIKEDQLKVYGLRHKYKSIEGILNKILEELTGKNIDGENINNDDYSANNSTNILNRQSKPIYDNKINVIYTNENNTSKAEEVKKRNFSNLRKIKTNNAVINNAGYDSKKTNYIKYDLNNIKNINNNHNNNYNYNNYNKEENLNNNEIQRKVLGKRRKQYENIYNLAKYNNDRENETNEFKSRLEAIIKKLEEIEVHTKGNSLLDEDWRTFTQLIEQIRNIKKEEKLLKRLRLTYLYKKAQGIVSRVLDKEKCNIYEKKFNICIGDLDL